MEIDIIIEHEINEFKSVVFISTIQLKRAALCQSVLFGICLYIYI